MNAGRPEEANSSTADDSHPEERSPGDHAEVFTYTAPWSIYATSFTVNPHFPLRLAVSSFIEDPRNTVEVIQLNENTCRFEALTSFEHLYPPNKIMWIPDSAGSHPDLLATSGDGIRLWLYNANTTLKAHLHNTRSTEYCGPLTSFDWNSEDLTLIGTSSIDTTCTIWDAEKVCIRTQLIAHEKEVFDFAFAQGKNEFATVSADGSMRLFDLRNLEQSTIIFENPDGKALLRLAWNKVDKHYLAALCMDSSVVLVLDTRFPSVPVAKLYGHQNNVNSLDWAPHSSTHVCTAGDDCQAFIWDLSRTKATLEGGTNAEPILSYAAGAEISYMQWSHTQTDFISVAFNKTIQVLKV